MTPEPEDVLPVATAKELLAVTNLTKIRFYELRASTNDEAESNDEAEDAPIAVAVAYRKRAEGVDYRVSLEVPRPRGTILADAAAIYTFTRPVDLSDEALLDFGDNVAMMTVFPYLREAISDLARRLDDAVVLPVLPRGVLSFANGQHDAPEDALDGSDEDGPGVGD